MNPKTWLTAVGGGVALALTLAGCGDSAEEPAPVGGPTSGTTESTARTEVDEAHNEADTMFAQTMIVHHEGAVEMADLAVEKAAGDEVRTLAHDIAEAQGPEIDEMTSWLAAWGEESAVPDDMDGMDHGSSTEMEGMSQEEAMAELETLSGTEFDRRFLELMTAHHTGAVEMAETELDDGENPQARELAGKIAADQRAEIAQMDELLRAL